MQNEKKTGFNISCNFACKASYFNKHFLFLTFHIIWVRTSWGWGNVTFTSPARFSYVPWTHYSICICIFIKSLLFCTLHKSLSEGCYPNPTESVFPSVHAIVCKTPVETGPPEHYLCGCWNIQYLRGRGLYKHTEIK